MTTTPSTEPGGQTPPNSDPPGQTPNPQTQTPSGSQKTSIDTLPADIQEYIARLRSEAEEANKKSKAEARAKQQAEEARLAEQGEFKKLAEQHQLRVKELEPISERYSTLASQLASQIDTEIKDWPAEVKAFDPGPDAPIESRMAWLQKSRPLLDKLQQQARGQAAGNRPNPQASGQAGNKADQLRANREAFVRQRNYGI